jgi:hypothetical protein
MDVPASSLAGSTPDLPDDAEQTLIRWRHEALALAGAWSDMPDTDDKLFDALDRICHEAPPPPPLDKQLAWLNIETDDATR